MTRMTGRRALIEMLRAEGVKYVFGNPGTSESPIMDELESYPDLEYMLVLQEGVALGLADAYARATGKPAFVNLHIETGLANGISLLHNAHEFGTPLVISAGNKDIRELALGRTDLAEMVRLFTKWTAEVTHPEQVPTVLRRAFKEAKTPPTGPTFVGCSANALDDEGDMEILPSSDGYYRLAPDRRAIEDAAHLLATADNPTLLVSDRVGQSGASAEAVRVAELVGARVYAGLYTEMNFPSSHPQFMGNIRLGFQDSKELVSKSDVVLVVGKLTSHYNMFSSPVLRFFGLNTKLIHMDWDPQDVGKSQPTEVGIISDPKVGLGDLADALEAVMSGSAREAAKGRSLSLGMEKVAQEEAWQQQVKQRWDLKPMSAERMMAEIYSVLPDNAIIADDAVTTRLALHKTLRFDEPGGLFGGRGGAIGWGIGGAMGAKLANPDRPVVAIVGDGSAMMTVQGLWTAAVYNIPVVYVICNNRSYRVLKLNIDSYRSKILNQETPGSRYIGMDFPISLDIAGMAEAMEVRGCKIEDPTELRSALKGALELGRPAVLDVVIDGSV